VQDIELLQATASSQPLWKIKKLLCLHVVLFLMLWSLFPLTEGIWHTIDTAFFKWINGSLKGHPFWQLFWSLANHKNADWIEDFCILSFFAFYIGRAPKGQRLRRTAEFVFCAVYIGCIIQFFNKTLVRNYFCITRVSPSLIIENSLHLTQEIPWLAIKEATKSSFPGDHGTTALLFAASYAYFARWKLGLLASLYAAFLCLPRMIVGAHWLSDVIIGSGCVTLFFLSWAFCTPFAEWCIRHIERCFRFISAFILRPV
jgi:membrane-associated phospholipid phosphatase